jgi:hypothetical protein
MFYDVEGFFEFKNNFYLFTKIEVKVLTEPLFYIKSQYTWFSSSGFDGRI